jgi:excisionase family DNA binding protein
VTISEAARQLRVSRGTVYKLMASGELRFVLVGQSRRIRREALIEYLDRGVDATTA